MKVLDHCRLFAEVRTSNLDLMHIRDPKELEHIIKSDLRRCMVEEMLKRGEFTTQYDHEDNTQRTRLELYVFTPNEFHSVVRTLAHKMMDDYMRGPSPPAY